MRPLPLALCLASALGAETLSAAAQEASCPGGRRWVALSFTGTFPEGFERAVAQDLTAGLAARGIQVCPPQAREAATEAPLADIRLSAEREQTVGVSVDVRDSVTQKRVGRDIDLTRVPADGRAFAAALAADELLQASWVELALERGKRTEVRPPPEVQTTVETALRAGRRLPLPRLGARAAAEHFGGGQLHYGADATFEAPITAWLRFALSIGARQGQSVDSERGEILSSALGAETRFELVYYARPSFEAWLAAGVRGSRVRFEGRAGTGAVDSDYTGISLFARGGPGAALRVAGPLWLGLNVAAGAPLRAVEADDGQDTATGVAGLELSAGLGLGVEL